MIAIKVDEGSASKEQQKLAHGIRPLFRRDYMKVARHEMPGKWADMIRPVGNGMVRGAGLCSPFETIKQPGRPIIPYPTVRAPGGRLPRHFMPGYHQVVPTGQTRASRLVDARALSLRAIRRLPSTPTLHYSTTPRSRIRGQPVRRSRSSVSSTAQVGLASEARFTTETWAKSEGRRGRRERRAQ
jgi:hypothetical protein